MRGWFRVAVATCLVLVGWGTATPHPPEATFGTAKKTAFALKGRVYFIPPGTQRLPDFSRLNPVGRIYTTTLDVKPRRFTEGFPGVSDRFEWFAIDYRGRIYVPEDREYVFYLLSDDGARLIIDGRTVIDNDGIHPPQERSGRVFLKRGYHDMEVQYFQGPRYEVALVLSYQRGGAKVPFDIRAFTPLEVEETACELTLRLGSKVLFDFDRYDLKPEAMAILEEVVEEIKEIPHRRIVVEGHTDDIGSQRYNLRLSRRRAQAVASFLKARGIPAEEIETVGYGESRPLYPNTTEENRRKNRRVEIKLTGVCRSQRP